MLIGVPLFAVCYSVVVRLMNYSLKKKRLPEESILYYQVYSSKDIPREKAGKKSPKAGREGEEKDTMSAAMDEIMGSSDGAEVPSEETVQAEIKETVKEETEKGETT